MRSLAAICLTLALAVPAWATEIGPPELLKDLGFAGTSPRDFRRLGGVAVFKGGANGSTLWRTDGTALGTYPLLLESTLDTFGPDDGRQVYFLRVVGDARELWRTDGSEAGTISLTPGGLRFTQKLDRSDVRSPAQIVVPETGLLFFSATDGPDTDNYELWASDGTPGGTRLVKDINPQGASLPNSLATLGGKAFFVAQNAEGHDLWGSDGTAAGTSKVKDLHPGDDGIVYVKRAGDRLVLLAYHGSNAEIWTSDGTAAGTRLVKEIPGAVVTSLVPAGRHLFFAVARGLRPTELWSTDGTAAGTLAVVQDVLEPGDRNLYWEFYVYPAGEGVFFRLWDPEHGEEPWASDGAPQGTGRIADICPGACSSGPSFRGTYGSKALFNATDGVSGEEPRIAEVRPGGRTWRLGDLCPADCNSFASLLSTETGWIVYAAQGADGEELWVSDGSADGAVQVSHFEPEHWRSSFAGRSVVFGDRLVFGFQPVGEPGSLWSLTLPPLSVPPDPPPGDWITSPALPGFRVKGRITSGTEVRAVRSEPCIGETVCLSGAVPGRPELFVRVIGPRPNGYLWPTLVRFTTSQTEVWIEQAATGAVRYYLLEAVPRDSDELSGLVDRTGFRP